MKKKLILTRGIQGSGKFIKIVKYSLFIKIMVYKLEYLNLNDYNCI